MSTPIVIGGGPPPIKRWSVWAGSATAAVGAAALGSPDVTAAIVTAATKLAGDNAVGASLAVFGVTQVLLASRRWLQARAARK